MPPLKLPVPEKLQKGIRVWKGTDSVGKGQGEGGLDTGLDDLILENGTMN